MKTFRVDTTPRGFDRIDFKDANERECSLQQSSAIGDGDDALNRPGSSLLWMGRNEVVPTVLRTNEGWVPVPLPPDALINGRMHLTREQVEIIRDHLTAWLETGSLTNDAKE